MGIADEQTDLSESYPESPKKGTNLRFLNFSCSIFCCPGFWFYEFFRDLQNKVHFKIRNSSSFNITHPSLILLTSSTLSNSSYYHEYPDVIRPQSPYYNTMKNILQTDHVNLQILACQGRFYPEKLFKKSVEHQNIQVNENTFWIHPQAIFLNFESAIIFALIR